MKICMSKCLSYFKQYLIWTVIYLFMIIKNYTHGRKTIIEIIRDFFFCGSYFHLWYLPALITGLIIVSYLYKSGASSKKICLISVILYVIALLGQSYYSILNGVRDSISWFGDLSEAYFKIFDTTRNGLFEGTLFATLGLMLAKQSQNSLNDKDDYNADEQISKNISGSRFGYLMIIIVLFVINMIEAEAVYRFSLAREADFYITTPIICWFIFKFAASFSLPESYNEKEYEAYRKRSYYIRNITMLVYFVQIYVGMFIKDGIGFITHKDGSSYYLFLPVLFVSILVAWMITEIKYRMTKNMQQKEYK